MRLTLQFVPMGFITIPILSVGCSGCKPALVCPFSTRSIQTKYPSVVVLIPLTRPLSHPVPACAVRFAPALARTEPMSPPPAVCPLRNPPCKQRHPGRSDGGWGSLRLGGMVSPAVRLTECQHCQSFYGLGSVLVVSVLAWCRRFDVRNVKGR